jgi:hypothetical protein
MKSEEETNNMRQRLFEDTLFKCRKTVLFLYFSTPTMMRYSNTSLNSKFERLPGTRRNLISLNTPSPSSILSFSPPPFPLPSPQNSLTHKRSLSPPPLYFYDYAPNLSSSTDMESDPPSLTLDSLYFSTCTMH